MSKALFVTGTGTDIGKTYVSGLIVKALRDAGLNPGYYKAAVSGNQRDKEGILIPGDAVYVKNVSGIEQAVATMCPYIYEHAYSPHLAARIEGNYAEMRSIREGFERVCREYDYVTMEGSGGILCPINRDTEKIWLEDIIKELGLTTVIVADAGLGTINSVLLTVSYMKSKNIDIKGIIYNNYHAGDVMEDDNIYMCESMTGIKTLARVNSGDDMINIDTDLLKSLYEETKI